jgi:hypothetical protein
MKRALQSHTANQRRELRRLNQENENMHRELLTVTASRNFFETQAAHGGVVIHKVQKHFENLEHEHDFYKGGCVFCGRSRLEVEINRRKAIARPVKAPRVGSPLCKKGCGSNPCACDGA